MRGVHYWANLELDEWQLRQKGQKCQLGVILRRIACCDSGQSASCSRQILTPSNPWGATQKDFTHLWIAYDKMPQVQWNILVNLAETQQSQLFRPEVADVHKQVTVKVFFRRWMYLTDKWR